MVPNSGSTATGRNPPRRNYALIAVAVVILVGALAYVQLTQSSQKASDCALAETGRISLPNIPNRLDHMAFSADLKLLVVAARNMPARADMMPDRINAPTLAHNTFTPLARAACRSLPMAKIAMPNEVRRKMSQRRMMRAT